MIDLNNIVILILSTRDSSYDEMKMSQRQTWIKAANAVGLKCFFYEGNLDLSESMISGDTISVSCDDSLSSCAKKFKLTLNLIMDKYPDTKLIYRTNLSSYIDIDKFTEHLSGLNDLESEYSGYTGFFNKYKEYLDTYKFLQKKALRVPLRKKYHFCSGSGVFIGCEYFDKILTQNKYDRYIDDVMIRLAIQVEPKSHIDRFDFVSNNNYLLTNQEYNKRLNDGLFHYRFKTDNRTNDAKLLYLCHDVNIRRFLCTKVNDFE